MNSSLLDEAPKAHSAALVEAYPYLRVLSSSAPVHVQAAANLRRQLVRVFPDVSFTVRSSCFSDGDWIDVTWLLGPTESDVRKISDRYQSQRFGAVDADGECWRDAFGGARRVQVARCFGVAFDTVARAISVSNGIPYDGHTTVIPELGCTAGVRAYAILSGTGLPAEAVVTGCECAGPLSGDYRVFFTAPGCPSLSRVFRLTSRAPSPKLARRRETVP